MKTCNKCKQTKALTEFTTDNTRKDGKKSSCKTCCALSLKMWIANNPEKAREYAAKRYHENAETIKQRRKELRQIHPEKYRENSKQTRLKNISHYKRKGREASWKRAGISNMTYERYENMLEHQNFCCAICSVHQDKLAKNLGVDHNHVTGEPRGLLCDACNRAIGYLKESEFLLSKAVNYLKLHNDSR